MQRLLKNALKKKKQQQQEYLLWLAHMRELRKQINLRC